MDWQTCRLGRRSSHPPHVLYKAVAFCRWVPHLALESWCHPEHMRVEQSMMCLSLPSLCNYGGPVATVSLLV